MGVLLRNTYAIFFTSGAQSTGYSTNTSIYLRLDQIRVITKLPNTKQSSKGKIQILLYTYI